MAIRLSSDATDQPEKREARRLAELHRLDILDSPAEEAFDRLVRIAAYICGTPISLVTLIDAHRQWFKARLGLDLPETPRAIAFCTHAIEGDGVTVVENAAKDSRFAENPLVTGDPEIRFYAGAPLRTRAGVNLGTLCVIDRAPRRLAQEQLDRLADLAAVAVDEMELRLANRRLTELTQTDPMTGAYNRRHFMQLAETERARARRYERPLSVLIFDIDHFKRVNDTLGHAAGDVAIIEAVQEAKATLRRQDVLARIGGEEFAVLLPETDLEGGRLIAERLRARIAKRKLAHEGRAFEITVSVGVALVDLEAGTEEALKRADAALYAAKRAGRNRVAVDPARPR